MKVFALTTKDNPFNPLIEDEFENWFLFDVQHNYNSCEYLARIAQTSYELSDSENQQEIERAIDEIISLDFLNIYKKVSLEIPDES